MKAFLITLIFAFSHCVSVAQKDTLTRYFDESWGPADEGNAFYRTLAYKDAGVWHRFDYYISNGKLQMEGFYKDSLFKIKEGPFSYYGIDGNKEAAGQYKNGKKYKQWQYWNENGTVSDSSFYNENGIKTGINRSYYPGGAVASVEYLDDLGSGKSLRFWDTGIIKDSGEVKEGNKTGEWYFYDKAGKICQRAVFVNDSATSFTCYQPDGSIQTENCYLENEASFKNGNADWIEYLKKKLAKANLPADYSNGKVFGEVRVSFKVDINGNTTDIKIVRSVHPELDKIAVDIIRKSPAWNPAIQYNRPVNAYRTQPFKFSQVK